MNGKRPYKLPEPLLCSADKEINMTLVDEYIRKHEERIPRYRYLENLYKGFHDVFRLPEKESWKPDNRLAVNFPRYITETFLGYAYGIPVKTGITISQIKNTSWRRSAASTDMLLSIFTRMKKQRQRQ